jgi:hypothetical protein
MVAASNGAASSASVSNDSCPRWLAPFSCSSRAGLIWCQAPSGAHDKICNTVRQLQVCWCGAPSLTRGWACRLQLLLVLASAVILGTESHGTHDHILLYKFETSPNLEGQGPCIYILQEQDGLVISPDSQGYDGGIRTLIHTGLPLTDSDSTNSQRTIDSLCSLGTEIVENTASHLSHCCALRSCCTATGVFAEPFPSNSCFCCFHSSWVNMPHCVYSYVCAYIYIYTKLDVRKRNNLEKTGKLHHENTLYH